MWASVRYVTVLSQSVTLFMRPEPWHMTAAVVMVLNFLAFLPLNLGTSEDCEALRMLEQKGFISVGHIKQSVHVDNGPGRRCCPSSDNGLGVPLHTEFIRSLPPMQPIFPASRSREEQRAQRRQAGAGVRSRRGGGWYSLRGNLRSLLSSHF
ncbi:hypothetical protein NDU88_006625 [Pleurodeles waltl]|uniref:Uncharacterized protein n=1 Tax=Pleurodeles waltl TaxID=8319 RepID=A0AAV7QP39_PLEWA|nr:hypothetical protein NDU88_006625 [Pleurodeles waltl]